MIVPSGTRTHQICKSQSFGSAAQVIVSVFDLDQTRQSATVIPEETFRCFKNVDVLFKNMVASW